MNKQSTNRCHWCGTDPLYVKYHDEEWGKPVFDDKVLFEFLILEGAQAGLSWITILRRREGYRAAFLNFDVQKVAQLTEAGITEVEGVSVDLYKDRVWWVVEKIGLLPEYRDDEDDLVDEIEDEEDDYYKVEEDFDFEIDDSKFYI